MSAVTKTVSFFEGSPGLKHYESLPAGQRSSFVRHACDDAARGGGNDPVISELRALRRDVKALYALMTEYPVTLPSPRTEIGGDEDDPRLDGLAEFGL